MFACSQEWEIDKYFLHFKKVATSLEWPKDVWTFLLQSVLVGKAQEVYAALAPDQSSDYDTVKSSILNLSNHRDEEVCRRAGGYYPTAGDSTIR